MGARKKVTEAMWETVDWELPVKDVAKKLRCSIHLVYLRARIKGIVRAKRRKPCYGIDWSAVDWSERNNTVISEKCGVTRERVRQVRPFYDKNYKAAK